MCCGRGVKKAASQQYVSPLLENTMNAKKAAPVEPKFPDAKVVMPQGAYYGNPIERKKVKEKKVVKPEADTKEVKG